MENAMNREHMLVLIQQKHLEIIQTALVSIQTDGPSCASDGICCNIELEFERMGRFWTESRLHSWLYSTFELWPEFSGRTAFPVQTLDDAGEQYIKASDNSCMWDSSTDYGKARYRLLDFLIEQIEKDILYVRSR